MAEGEIVARITLPGEYLEIVADGPLTGDLTTPTVDGQLTTPRLSGDLDGDELDD